MSKIKELWFCKELIDREKAAALNGESGYYSVSDNIFSEGHSMYTSGMDYYTEAKAIFDCDVPSEPPSNYTTLMIVKFSDTTNLSALFLPSGGYPGVDYDSSNYYWRNPLTCIGDGYRYDLTNGELVYNTHYQGSNTWTTYASIDFMIYNTAQLDMYYNGGNRNINYANIDSLQGYGSGGWQVPNPNPTRKIMLNGVLYSQVGGDPAETESIILNGNRYSGGNKTNCEIVSKDTIINANGNFSYDVSELEAGYYLATFTSNLEKNSGLTEDHGNLRPLFFYFDGTNQTTNYSFDFTVNGGSYGAFQIVFAKSVYNILLTTWGGWQITEIKMNLAKVDPLVVEMYT